MTGPLLPAPGLAVPVFPPRTPCPVPRELRPCEVPAVCAACGKQEPRPRRAGDAPGWKRGPDGWLLVPAGGEVCSQACLDKVSPLPLPPAELARRPAPKAPLLLVAALLGMAAASDVDIEPPPPRRGR